MAKKRSRSARRTRRRGGVVEVMTNEQMTMKGPTHDGVPTVEPDDVSFMPPHLQSSFAVRKSMKPEDEKVGMAPVQPRKAGRKTRRRARRARRGGGLGENSATWPPDKSSFGAKIGSPENTDNLLGYVAKAGKRRSLKRK
jgi:hypothetical protein